MGVRKFAIKLYIAVTLTIGLLAAAEGAAWLLYRHRGGGSDEYVYKSYVVWQAARPHGSGITVDVAGLRRTLNSHCEAENYTIWMFGGSGLWGHYNSDGETIASWLAKQYEESGRRVCVRNYGQRGWASTQEVIELLLELKRAPKRPDFVIFYDGTVDSILPCDSDEVDVHLEFPRFKKRFESWGSENEAGFEYIHRTNTYLTLQWAADKLGLNDTRVRQSIPAQKAASMAQGTLNNYLKNMEILDSLAAHYDFRYICFWEPWLPAAQKPLSTSEKSVIAVLQRTDPAGTEVTNVTYKLFRTVNSPHLVYLSDLLNGHSETLFADPSHLNGEGNRLVAERISQAVQDLRR